MANSHWLHSMLLAMCACLSRHICISLLASVVACEIALPSRKCLALSARFDGRSIGTTGSRARFTFPSVYRAADKSERTLVRHNDSSLVVIQLLWPLLAALCRALWLVCGNVSHCSLPYRWLEVWSHRCSD